MAYSRPMTSPSGTHDKASAGDPLPPKCSVIEVHVGELKQLFNAIDPSQFRDKDLDPKAEEFIVGWAKDLPRDATLALGDACWLRFYRANCQLHPQTIHSDFHIAARRDCCGNLFHDLLFWVTIRRSNHLNYSPACDKRQSFIICAFRAFRIPKVPYGSLKYPGLL